MVFVSVLPDSSSSHEYTPNNPALISSPMFGGKQITSTVPPATDLDPLLCGSPRYSDNNSYYPNNWSSNSGYSNNYNYYNSTPNNQNQYLNTGGTTMVLYPHLYSTVNQNQIHLHLHGSPDKIDHYFNHENLSNVLTPVRNSDNEIAIPSSSTVHESQDQKHEIGGMSHEQSPTTDPSVWRPYWHQ